MRTKQRSLPRRTGHYTATVKSPPPAREAVAVIAELMQKRPKPTRSREEQAFIDLQRVCHQ